MILPMFVSTTGISADGTEFVKSWVLDWSKVAEASWFALPDFMPVKPVFDLRAILPVLIMFVVTAVETVGDISGVIEGGLDREASDKELSGGVICDGLGSSFATFFGVLPNTSFSQNVGLIPLTKVASKHVAVMAGILLVVLGLFPKFAALINGIPQPVLGGVGIVMFGTVAAAGIKTLSKVEINDRNLLIIATSIGLGLGVTFRPDFISNLPEGLQMVFSSGISTGTIVALVLNIVLKDDKNNEIENIKDLECEGA